MKSMELWKKYILENPDEKEKEYNVFYFDNNKETSNDLLDLVMKGIKKAYSFCLYSYRINNKTIPKKDDLSIITDLKGNAYCIIKNTRVNIVRYNQVSAKMVLLEGEGDKSLKYWRGVHEPLFISDCKKINKNFNDSIPIVFVEFEIVYKKD